MSNFIPYKTMGVITYPVTLCQSKGYSSLRCSSVCVNSCCRSCILLSVAEPRCNITLNIDVTRVNKADFSLGWFRSLCALIYATDHVIRHYHTRNLTWFDNFIHMKPWFAITYPLHESTSGLGKPRLDLRERYMYIIISYRKLWI